MPPIGGNQRSGSFTVSPELLVSASARDQRDAQPSSAPGKLSNPQAQPCPTLEGLREDKWRSLDPTHQGIMVTWGPTPAALWLPLPPADLPQLPEHPAEAPPSHSAPPPTPALLHSSPPTSWLEPGTLASPWMAPLTPLGAPLGQEENRGCWQTGTWDRLGAGTVLSTNPVSQQHLRPPVQGRYHQ